MSFWDWVIVTAVAVAYGAAFYYGNRGKIWTPKEPDKK